MEPAMFLTYRRADDVDTTVTLPDGTIIDISHFAELDEYLGEKERYPLFRERTIEKYFEEKIGPDWPEIVALQDQLHREFIKDVEEPFSWKGFDPEYRFRFFGTEEPFDAKNGNLYVFEFHAYYHGQDHGGHEYRLKMNSGGTVVDKEHKWI